MLNTICTALLLAIVGVMVFAGRNALEYRLRGKVYTYTNLALLNAAFYTLFTVRTILFYNNLIPQDMMVGLMKVSPKLQGIVDTVSKATAGNVLSEAMFWVFAVFFVITALIRAITGYKALRLGYLISFFFLISSLQLFGTSPELLGKYDSLLMGAIVLWIGSMIAVKVQTVINVSKKQKQQAAEGNETSPIQNSPPHQPM